MTRQRGCHAEARVPRMAKDAIRSHFTSRIRQRTRPSGTDGSSVAGLSGPAAHRSRRADYEFGKGGFCNLNLDHRLRHEGVNRQSLELKEFACREGLRRPWPVAFDVIPRRLSALSSERAAPSGPTAGGQKREKLGTIVLTWSLGRMHNARPTHGQLWESACTALREEAVRVRSVFLQ